jgi:hypothetical protein
VKTKSIFNINGLNYAIFAKFLMVTFGAITYATLTIDPSGGFSGKTVGIFLGLIVFQAIAIVYFESTLHMYRASSEDLVEVQRRIILDLKQDISELESEIRKLPNEKIQDRSESSCDFG